MSKRDETRLLDMLDAARKAREFVKDRTRDDLDSNDMLALALVRLLEIVGEAARYVVDSWILLGRSGHRMGDFAERSSSTNRRCRRHY